GRPPRVVVTHRLDSGRFVHVRSIVARLDAQPSALGLREMSELVYSAITSIDGYVADPAGNFDWAAPDEEVHDFINDLERPIGTYLYGRRMYETMVHWETTTLEAANAATRDCPPI